MNTTFERLSALLVQDYKLAPERLSPETPLESLGIDSLGTVELMWTVEDMFQIKPPPDPVDLKTLADVVRYVDLLVSRRAAASKPAPAALHAR